MKFIKLLFLKKSISKLVLLLFACNFFIPNAKAEMEIFIESTAEYFTELWFQTPGFEKMKPPQIISLDSDSKILIGCRNKDNSKNIGGSSYCSFSNTIFLTNDQLDFFYELKGKSGIAYLMAHEFAHAVQHAVSSELDNPAKELQADCIAGIFTSSMLNISRAEMLSLAQLSLHLGSDDHGTGSQRAYALLTGLGVIEGTCFDNDIINLARGKIKNKSIMRILNSRSNLESIDIEKTPYPKTLLHVLNSI
jgi:hypothetical protein